MSNYKSAQARMTAADMRRMALEFAGKQPGDVARVWKYRGGVTVTRGNSVVLNMTRQALALSASLSGWGA